MKDGIEGLRLGPTSTRKRLLALAREGHTRAKAAALLGLSRQRVTQLCQADPALDAAFPRGWVAHSASDMDMIRDLAAEGLTVPEVMARTGWTRGRVDSAKAKAGIKLRRAKSGPRQGGKRAAGTDGTLSRAWFAARLTEGERADYRLLRGSGGYTALEALAAIKRHDLVAEVTAHRGTRAAGQVAA